MFALTLDRVALFAVLATTAVGCASSGSTAGGNAAATAAHHDRYVITSEELVSSQASNLFDVVQRLHPEWLKTTAHFGTASNATGQPTPAASMDVDVQVYMDTQHAGSTDILKEMSVSTATSLRYFSASEAQGRFGNGNQNGAIQVITTVKR